MAIDYDTGDVTCNVCHKLIGNYKIGNFHKLIRQKYCPQCKKDVVREQKRYSAQKSRRTFRKYKSLVREQLEIKDNELRTLRKMVGIETKTIEVIKEEMLHKRGYTVVKNAPIKCGGCGAVQEGGYPFCRMCGKPLRQDLKTS